MQDALLATVERRRNKDSPITVRLSVVKFYHSHMLQNASLGCRDKDNELSKTLSITGHFKVEGIISLYETLP